jgi:hypothetical protein
MAEVLNYSTGRSGGGVVIARASNDYRWRRYALVIFFFGYGLYSAYDGFIHYPNDNAEFHRKYPLAEKLPHPAYDLPFNQGFGIGLPILSLALLGWVFYNSRGSYQFDGQTLSVPGHPPVPVKSIVKVDRDKWDRKGIAYLHYQASGSAKLGVIRIDDFIYDRVPTDEIFKQIESLVEANRTAVAAPPAGSR